MRLLGLTLRFRFEGEDRLQEIIATGQRVILASWHSRVILAACYMRELRPVVVMISRSRDGEYIAEIAERLGIDTIRGSSSRGGGTAVRELIDQIRGGKLAGHFVDGPRGPAGSIKPGIVYAAQHSGAWIIPFYGTAVTRFDTHSWDRMQVPLPFSRVLGRVGAPIAVPADLSREEFESIRKSVEEEMHRGYASLEAESKARQLPARATSDG